MRGGQVDGGVAEMVGADFLRNSRFGRFAIYIGNDRDELAVRLERFNDHAEFKVAAFFERPPESDFVTMRCAAGAAMNYFDRRKTALRLCRRIAQRSLGGHHGFEERQRNRRSQATKNGAPRNLLFGNEHVFWLSLIPAFLDRRTDASH